MHPVLTQMIADAPLIFGHRGARAYAPMNTIPAFELALEQGAQGVELDVYLSADSEIVVIHDDTVDATTDGAGEVRTKTLAELKDLDAGAWFAPEYAGTCIPTLDEVFEAIGQRAWVNVEIKSTTEDTDGIESAVAECLTRHQMQERVIVSSFNPYALRRFRDIMPQVPLGYLYHPAWDTRALMHNITYEAYHPYYDIIDETLMQQANRAGHMVNTWTINDPDEALRLHQLGVHTFITDNPDTLVAKLRP